MTSPSDLRPPKSTKFEEVPPTVSLRYCVHKNGMKGQPENLTPPATAVVRAENGNNPEIGSTRSTERDSSQHNLELTFERFEGHEMFELSSVVLGGDASFIPPEK